MADLFEFKVTGLQELAKNLAAFGSPKILDKICGNTLRAGAALPLQRSRMNARALGLGYMGFKPRRDREGMPDGEMKRYGRIPRSMKAGRPYNPRDKGKAAYRLNVVARGQRSKGLYKNAAPHAHLIEYGWVHKHAGRIAGRPFAGPALDQTAGQTIEVMATRMRGLIDGLKFPSTGKGP